MAQPRIVRESMTRPFLPWEGDGPGRGVWERRHKDQGLILCCRSSYNIMLALCYEQFIKRL